MKTIDDLCLLDNILMDHAYNNDTRAMEELLRPVMNNFTLVVKSSVSQAISNNDFGKRNVRLDALATDDKNRYYNIEVQRADAGASPLRARYNLSMLDKDMLNQGEKDLEKLPESYVIFFTEHDVLHRNEQISRYEFRNSDDNSVLGTRQHIIYVNCASEEDTSTPLGRLIHDLKCKDYRDMFNPRLAEKVKYYKEGPGRMMINETIQWMYGEELDEARKKAMAEGLAEGMAAGKAEGLAAGKAEGKAESQKDIARRMLMLGYGDREIMNITGLSEEELAALKKTI